MSWFLGMFSTEQEISGQIVHQNGLEKMRRHFLVIASTKRR